MLAKTSGIIIHSLKYSDSANIVTAYTRQFGRVSYMAYGSNKKKSVCRNSLLQPLSVVELEVSYNQNKDIQRLKEVRCDMPLMDILSSPIKNTIAIFIAEFLYRTLHNQEADEGLFLFLKQSIHILEENEKGIANFHLIFLMKFSQHLGFNPNIEEEREGYFDLINGVFCLYQPNHPQYLSKELSKKILQIIQSDYSEMHLLIFSRQERVEILEAIIEFFKLHIPNFHGLNSLDILQCLFD